MRNRKIISVFLILLIILAPISTATSTINAEKTITNQNKNSNQNQIIAPEVYADSAILLDVGSDKLLYEKNSKERKYPASTTKLLTAIVVVENCPDLSQLVNISYHSVNSVPYSYSTANLMPEEKFSIKDLLNALLIQSANEAAYSLAEYVANKGNNYPLDDSLSSKERFDNSIAIFSNMMNSKAKELGCENSNFVNPNGIHNDSHYSTAYDLMLIGKCAYNIPTLMSICSSTQFSLPNTSVYTDEVRTFNTTNSLIRTDKSGYYEYANGLKTGYTDPAQSCIIASAHKNDRDLVAIVLHSEGNEDPNQSRENDCKRLFEFGFNTYSNAIIVNEKEIINELKIKNGTKDTKMLNGLCSKELKTLIVTAQPPEINPEINITKDVAPISKGEIIGSVSYTLNGETYTADLLAEHDVIPINYGFYILIGASIFFVILLLIILIVFIKKRKKF